MHKIIYKFIRDISSIIIVYLWAGIFPYYFPPFSGCKVSGYLTFQPFCSDWPDFIKSFIAILVIALVSYRKRALISFVSLSAIIITSLGGLMMIKTGEAIPYFNEYAFNIMIYIIDPILHGIFAAILLLIAYKYVSGNFRKFYA